MAANPAKFDLHCTGVLTNILTGQTSPWTNWIKIDLDSRQYCLAGCLSKPPDVDPIQEVTADRIVLEDEGKDKYNSNTIVISRVDGAIRLENRSMDVGVAFKVQGKCTASQFTGFPKTLF